MAIPDLEKARVEQLLRKFVEDVPAHVRDKLQHTYSITKNEVVLSERRPDWRDKSKWMEHPICKIKYGVTNRDWSLYWQDRNLKWHQYRDCVHVRDFKTCFDEVMSDPTCIFFG